MPKVNLTSRKRGSGRPCRLVTKSKPLCGFQHMNIFLLTIVGGNDALEFLLCAIVVK
jgi:hypothetical protein